ncbi:MAG: hypothetical protein J6334_00495 [Kiritimatiellae bacterium]|nr:hypothetical protein [Kiritimatiellia bacterium]
MQLNDEQQGAVRSWLADGASLSDVQKRLKETFGISMTYMDVRLLVLEIGAEVKDKPEPKAKTPPPEPEEEPYDVPPPEEDEPLPEEAGDGTEPDEGTRTNVRMTLDQIVVPGAMVSGDVVFSDGVKARWLIDQMGRFGLEPSQPGYRPTDADLRAFQIQLRVELQRKGYM